MTPTDKRRFDLTQDHIDLLSELRIRWQEAEYGAPAGDAKRPFGNSGRTTIEREIAEILDAPESEPERSEAVAIYHELDTALEVVLRCQTFDPGVFLADEHASNWSRATVDELGLEVGDECPVCGSKYLSGPNVVAVSRRANGQMWCTECRAHFRG